MNEQNHAIAMVLEMFGRAVQPNPPFPPTEMFSEGWMLRLIMDSHLSGHGGLPIPHIEGTSWYSEARLSSPFQPSRRGDPHGEGQTHADGVIGHFHFRSDTKAGLSLTSDPTQFVVIEAKMGSKLAKGTSRVPWFDQAARNVAAMAWVLWESGVAPESLQSLAFIVIAPEDRVLTDRTFAGYANKRSIMEKVQRRIELYRQDDPDRHAQLEQFHADIFEPFLERLDIFVRSWETSIRDAREHQRPILDFYDECRRINGLDE